MKNCIICLGAGKAQMPIIETAKKLNYFIIGIDQNRESIGFKIVNKKVIISTYDSKAVVAELIKLKDKYNYNYIGVIARTSGPALYTAAEISETFGLSGLTAEVVTLATEKSTLRNFCRQNNLPAPKGIKVELNNFIKTDCNLPVIVKPDLPIIGKKAVKLITDSDKLGQAVQFASEASYNGMVEIEEFIEGFDIGCLFRINKNTSSIIAYWDEMVGIKKNWEIIGCGVSVPSVIKGTTIENKVKIIVEKFTKSLSSKIEAILILAFRIDLNGDPNIIELHADLGGDLIADDLFPASDPSYNYFESCISIATNSSNDLSVPSFQPTALLYDDIFKNKIPSLRTVNIIKSGSLLRLHSKIDREFENYDGNFYAKPLHSKLTYQKNNLSRG